MHVSCCPTTATENPVVTLNVYEAELGKQSTVAPEERHDLIEAPSTSLSVYMTTSALEALHMGNFPPVARPKHNLARQPRPSAIREVELKVRSVPSPVRPSSWSAVNAGLRDWSATLHYSTAQAAVSARKMVGGIGAIFRRLSPAFDRIKTDVVEGVRRLFTAVDLPSETLKAVREAALPSMPDVVRHVRLFEQHSSVLWQEVRLAITRLDEHIDNAIDKLFSSVGSARNGSLSPPGARVAEQGLKTFVNRLRPKQTPRVDTRSLANRRLEARRHGRASDRQSRCPSQNRRSKPAQRSSATKRLADVRDDIQVAAQNIAQRARRGLDQVIRDWKHPKAPSSPARHRKLRERLPGGQRLGNQGRRRKVSIIRAKLYGGALKSSLLQVNVCCHLSSYVVSRPEVLHVV